MSVAVVDGEKLRVIKEAVYARFQKLLSKRETLSREEMKTFDRTIWRLGELRISEATQDLITLAQSRPGDEITTYSIIWSLGRIGDPAGLDVLSTLEGQADLIIKASEARRQKEKEEAERRYGYYYGGSTEHDGTSIEKICLEVRYWLTPENRRADFLDGYASRLPEKIRSVLADNNPENISITISEYLRELMAADNQKSSSDTDGLSTKEFIKKRDLHITRLSDNSRLMTSLFTFLQELENATYFSEDSENHAEIKTYIYSLLDEARIGAARYESRQGGFADFVSRSEGVAAVEPDSIQPPSCLPCLKSDAVKQDLVEYFRTIDTNLVRYTAYERLINLRFLQISLQILRNEKEILSELPDETEVVTDATDDIVEEEAEQNDLVIETLYLISLHNPIIRQALFALIETIQLTGNVRKGAFRTLWKMAEFREDYELYAHIIRKLEKNKAVMSSYSWDDEIGYQSGFGVSTSYFSRRSWRTLRKLGKLGALNYVDYAEAILLTMQDNDGSPVETKHFSTYSWGTGETNSWDVTYSEFHQYQAFGHILFNHSNKYEKSPSGSWVVKDSKASDGRTEAFPELWDRYPEKLFNFLKVSECEAVHTFAAKALADNKDYLNTIAVEEWFELLNSKYEQTALLALKALQQYYADKEPDTQVIKACLTSGFKQIRDAGLDWLKRASYILQDDLELLTWLVMSEDQDLRSASQEYVYILDGQADKQQEFLEQLLGKLYALGEDADKHIVENVRWVLLAPLKSQLSIITFDAVGMFVSHASPYVSLVGAQILTAQNLKPHEIPPELYGQLFNSSSPEVRAEAVALMSNLEDAELAQWDEMLGNLMLSAHAPVRAEARKLITRAAQVNDDFAAKILQKLIGALFKSESAEGLHDDLFNVFNDELKPLWKLIDKNQLWRMLTAKSKGIQRISAVVIHTRPYSDYTVRQWATLSGNPSIGVRAWAWKAYETELDLIKEKLDDALHIFSSNWEDSRSFGFNFFSKNFPFDQWSEEQVIALCDNKHGEVQELGRNLVFEHIQVDRGPRYLLALSEHPSVSMQKFIGQFLERLAAGKNDEIFKLEQYFASVLTRVNKARVAKDQVLSFLHAEGIRDRKIAELVARIMQSLSLSAAIYDKAKAIEIMSDLSNRYPGLAMPIKVMPVQVRGYQNNNDMQEAG